MRNGGRDIKGILFKNWKIKAIADSPPDKEWQTRRTIKIDPLVWLKCDESRYCFVHKDSCEHHIFKSRYLVGEVVYIGESHRYLNGDGEPNDFWLEYRDGTKIGWRDNGLEMDYPLDDKWRSPMFLKAKYARYFIKVTGVRAERLQSITEEDALMEGIKPIGTKSAKLYGYSDLYNRWDKTDGGYDTARTAYRVLWDSINGRGSWDKNDFVWKYSFIKVGKP